MVEVEKQLRAAMHAAGYPYEGQIVFDGYRHRVPDPRRTKSNQDFFYQAFPDPPFTAIYGSWADCGPGRWHKWTQLNRIAMSQEEHRIWRKRVLDAQTARANIRARSLDQGKVEAEKTWKNACPADPQHPYLQRKKVEPYGIRQKGDALLIAVRDLENNLLGLQFIKPNGRKMFLKNTAKEGNFYLLGKIFPKGKLLVAEGYATAASLHEATGLPVVVAFDCGNLRAVATLLRVGYPEAQIIICADDDQWTEGNPGVRGGKIAAKGIDGLLAIPVFAITDNNPTDFNDLHQLEGLEAVRRQIESAAPLETERAEPREGLEVIRGCDVNIEPIAWLWPGWLAVGKLHILAGAPGTGKTTLALDLAAVLTTGGIWPDGAPAPESEVAVWSGEDDPADTLAPRLKAAGADLSKVHLIRGVTEEGEQRPFDPARDIPSLAAYLRLNRAIKFLVVDPVVSAVSGDSHKNTEVRRNLQPLVDLGATCGCAILGISHFSKGTAGRDPIERVTGSIAFGAIARIVLAAAKLADDEDGKRLFARAKSNIGPDSGGWHYQLETIELADYPGVITSKVTWSGSVEGSARELLDTAETMEDSEEKTAKGEAKEFLRDTLEHGPVPAKRVFADAKANGIADRTLKRAKKSLGVLVEKTGMAGGWQWSLPSKEAKKSEEGQQYLVEPFEGDGPLQEIPEDAQCVLQLTDADFMEEYLAG